MAEDYAPTGAEKDEDNLTATLGATSPLLPPLTALHTALSTSPTSPSQDDPSSPRHHIRTTKVVEASHIPPRALSWKCCAEEGGGLQLAEEAVGRSWDDEKERDEGVPCPAPAEIRTVDSETVRVERTDGSPPRSPHGTLVRRRSLRCDPDSPD
ncbi:hypothetical protein JCM11251_004345 [Rhodosporidiobolus azoricus]